jgi:hypothetical protein
MPVWRPGVCVSVRAAVPTCRDTHGRLTYTETDSNVGIFVSYEVKVKLHAGLG